MRFCAGAQGKIWSMGVSRSRVLLMRRNQLKAIFKRLPWLAAGLSCATVWSSCGLFLGNDCVAYPEARSLHGAASRGDLVMVRSFVEAGADVNEDGRLGDRPLHQAAKAGHWPVVDYLISKGAEVGIKDWIGSTPLHEAAEQGQFMAVRSLV